MTKEPTKCLQQSLERWSTVLAWLVTVGAIAYTSVLKPILAKFAGFYTLEAWRQPLLDRRLIAYRTFLLALAAALWLFTLVLRHFGTPNKPRIAPARGQLKYVVLLLLACTTIDVWLSYRLWNSYGRPCFDGYCQYSELIRAWIIHATSANAQALLSFARGYVHANSPVGPFLIGVISIITGLSIDVSYALLSGIATLGSLAICWGWLRQRDDSVLDRIQFATFLLVLTHPALVRSFVFLQTDALTTLFILAVITLGMLRFSNPQRWQLPVGALLLSMGLLTKLSFLPALAIIPVMQFIIDFKVPRRLIKNTLQTVLVLVVVPVLNLVVFQYLMGTHAEFSKEMHMRGYVDRSVFFIAEVSLRTVMFFVPLIVVGYKDFTTREYLLASSVVIYLMSLWLGGAPGWDRHYLPIIFPLAPLAVFGLERLARSFGPVAVWSYVLLAAVLQYSVTALAIVQ